MIASSLATPYGPRTQPGMWGVLARKVLGWMSVTRSKHGGSSGNAEGSGRMPTRPPILGSHFFFSLFNCRFSFALCWLFFCCSFLPLSFFPLSPISITPFSFCTQFVIPLKTSLVRRSGHGYAISSPRSAATSSIRGGITFHYRKLRPSCPARTYAWRERLGGLRRRVPTGPPDGSDETCRGSTPLLQAHRNPDQRSPCQ